MSPVYTPVRSRYGQGTLRHIVEHQVAGLYAQPTPPALCGSAPAGGWVAMPSQIIKDCPRCLAKVKALDAADAAALGREPRAEEP